MNTTVRPVRRALGKKLGLLAVLLLGALGVWRARPQSAAYDGDGGPAT